MNLDTGRVTVRRTLIRVDRGGAPRFGTPNTAKGQRSVTLTPATTAALRGHKTRQTEQWLRLGADWAGYDLAFSTSLGTALRDSDVHRMLKCALMRAGLPTVSPHAARHTAATLMLEAGVNPRVDDRLGHADVAITLRRYSQVTDSMEADAAARMAKALHG